MTSNTLLSACEQVLFNGSVREKMTYLVLLCSLNLLTKKAFEFHFSLMKTIDHWISNLLLLVCLYLAKNRHDLKSLGSKNVSQYKDVSWHSSTDLRQSASPTYTWFTHWATAVYLSVERLPGPVWSGGAGSRLTGHKGEVK